MFSGRKVTIRYRAGLRDIGGNAAHAETDIRKRVIVLDPELKRHRRQHRRILLHEYFHFVWVRLGNPRRLEWEAHLKAEWKSRTRGEAGWSAEWRKKHLSGADIAKRSRRWREYCCESFCDTASWILSGVASEVTLAPSRRRERRVWFQAHVGGGNFPI